MSKNLLRISALIALVACIAIIGPQLLASPQNKDAQVLMALDAEWSKAAVAKDVDKVVSFYAEDAVAYPPNEPAAKGRAAAKKIWASYFALPAFQISWKTNAAGANGDTGYTAGTYQLSFKGTDGKTVKEVGKYLCVYRKGADGKWMAIHDMWNGDAK